MKQPRSLATLTKRQQYLVDDQIIAQALGILEQRMTHYDVNLSAPELVRNYVRLHLGTKRHEVFTVLFLNVKNRLIKKEDMFRGTLTHTSVYPREVVTAALGHNAASVMFVHNHPSGSTEPSEADQILTTALKQALALVDVRLLDHFVVAGSAAPFSFAEHGLL